VLGLELVVALGAAVLLGSLVARRLTVATPVVLVAAGVLLAAIPAFRRVGLPPATVLLLFLPALLYWESLTTSLREIRRYMRGIVLTSTVLVVFTSAAVAGVAHLLGLAWAPAWIIGAAVAPTDATAVAALGGALSRRNLTILRAESLINDGTALVLYGLAVGFATGETTIDAAHVSWAFLLSFGGGVLVGIVTARIVFLVRTQVTDPLHGNVITLLTPFLAFLGAEVVHASGVLAVVACGLYMSQVAPRAISAETRQQATAFWSLATFLLNGGLYVLVGLQLPATARELTTTGLGRAVAVTAAVYVTIILARILFLNVSIYAIRAIDRRPQQRLLRTTFRGRVVSTVAGFRGAVSLAVALSVPTGGTFPARDMIIFVTAGVVVISLVLQGLALPRVIRWAHLPADTSVKDELHLAQRTATEDALWALPGLAQERGVADEVAERVRSEYEEHLSALRAHEDGDTDAPTVTRSRQHGDLRLALITHKRATVVRLRDEGVIDDTVLRRIQARLDIEEIRLSDSPNVE
jgi:CPA1 family monovalent cation:H+ antiporter